MAGILSRFKDEVGKLVSGDILDTDFKDIDNMHKGMFTDSELIN